MARSHRTTENQHDFVQPQHDARKLVHELPAYLHPDFERLRAYAIAAMQASAVPVHGEPETWSSPIFPEELAQRMAASVPVFISRADAIRDVDARAWRAQ